MSDAKPKDHTSRINENIRKLGEHYDSPLMDDAYQDLIFAEAIDYVSENPGEYYVTLPGIILPLFS